MIKVALVTALFALLLGCTEKTTTLEEEDCTGSWTHGSDVLDGAWSGTLAFEQTINGVTKRLDLEAQLGFTDRSSPTDHLVALGFTGPWRVYGDFLESGLPGDVYAYHRFQADGPANTVGIVIDRVCIKDDLVLWAYDATYKLVDLVDYGLYDYVSSSVSEITMSAQERYEIRDGTLNVSAEAKSLPEASSAVSITVSGTLVRPD